MRKILQLLGPLTALLFFSGASADDAQVASEYHVKAAFLYNFTKFITWPGNNSLSVTHAANICIMGDSPFNGTLDILRKASSAQLAINIRRNVSQSDIISCHMLFISKSERENISSIIEAARAYPILTVSEVEEFARKGGMVEMVKGENNIGQVKVKLIINERSAESANLRIDAQLLEIASEVIK